MTEIRVDTVGPMTTNLCAGYGQSPFFRIIGGMGGPVESIMINNPDGSPAWIGGISDFKTLLMTAVAEPRAYPFSLQKLFDRYDAAATMYGYSSSEEPDKTIVNAVTDEYNAAKRALLSVILTSGDPTETNMKFAAIVEEEIKIIDGQGWTLNASGDLLQVAAYLQSLTTVNPISKLPQSPEMVRLERDQLLMSQEALLRQVERCKSLNRNRLRKIKKLKNKEQPK